MGSFAPNSHIATLFQGDKQLTSLRKSSNPAHFGRQFGCISVAYASISGRWMESVPRAERQAGLSSSAGLLRAAYHGCPPVPDTSVLLSGPYAIPNPTHYWLGGTQQLLPHFNSYFRLRDFAFLLMRLVCFVWMVLCISWLCVKIEFWVSSFKRCRKT